MGTFLFNCFSGAGANIFFKGPSLKSQPGLMFTSACDLAWANPFIATNKTSIHVNNLVQSIRLVILIVFMIYFF